MDKPLAICVADISNAPEAKKMLEKACRVRYVPATTQSLKENLAEAEVYFASLHVRLTKEMIANSPKLKAIATASTGLDHIDLEAAQQAGISVLSLKDDRELLDKITATAELAWALILACTRRIPEAVEATREGHWVRDALRGHQLSCKTLGILGCGRLGMIMSQYGQAFRMRVIGHDKADIQMPGAEQVSFEQLLKESDILTIHIHLTEENRNLINREAFAQMKRGAILINTSRGGIIDETALLQALEDGTLSTAGLDVICGEWRENLADHPLIAYSKTHKNLIITPHIGGVTYESQEMAYSATVQKLVDYLDSINE